MQQVSVFDIAQALIERSGSECIETVKLQKLCFYAFGWYAHLTGEALFPEAFYAMEKGPVVGELLSAHAGDRHISRDQLFRQLSAHEIGSVDFGAYIDQVLDYVWERYGSQTRWQLVETTHQEEVWIAAWGARRHGTKRGDLRHSEIIAFFRARIRPEQDDLLPMSCISRIVEGDLEAAVRAGQAPHAPFVDAVRARDSLAS